jgi:predicted DNA binding CopG/RHH family protein
MEKDTEKAEKSKFLTVKMTEEEVDRVREKAKKSGLTLSQVVRKLLNDYAKDEQFSLNF